MKELLKQSAAYNVWANRQLIEVIKKLPAHLVEETVASSFPSLEKTLLHMWDAESIWWQRLKLQEHIVKPSDSANLSLSDITAGISTADEQWYQWIAGTTDAALEHVFAYQNTKREQFKQPVFQMLLHLFNHNTYHRGQLVTIFHQLGVDKIPPTDFIVWSRSRK